MDPTLALLLVACFGSSLALFRIAGGMSLIAAARRSFFGHAALGLSGMLASCGLWWPVHAWNAGLPAADAPDASWALHWGAAALMAALAGAIGLLCNRRRFAAAAVIGLLLPLATYEHMALGAGALFRAAHDQGWIGVGGLAVTLSAALVALQLQLGDGGAGRLVRWAGCGAAAGIACLEAAVAPPAGQIAAPGAEWLLMAGLLMAAGLLLAALSQREAPTSALRARQPGASTVDNLTGLPTRLYFEGRLEAAAQRCEAKNRRMALFFIDLDGFKPVNDTFGHSSGDKVLAQVGERLKAATRGMALAARIGGDEFVFLAPGVPGAGSAATIAQRLIEALSQPYRIDDREVSISCSIGIALYPDTCRPQKLIARADAAMYAAKRAGGARHCFYAPEMDIDVQHNFDLLRDLRQALAKNELELFFQPKIDARTGKVTAAEALLRWHHPERGLVMPSHFIPLAERSGLIGPLGNWVIEAACQQSRAWRDKGLRMRVAINLSAHQMRQDDIAERIADALTRHRVHPSLLTCEITETAAMEDTGATQKTFRRLGELGTHLSIDDFGTGYSSLAYLRRLPAEELKIDASFVKDLDHSADARAVVDAVVKLAHALGLKVVAEGVETPRQQQLLVEMGCDELQGYLFAKPMSARALLLWAIDDRSREGFSDSLFGETRAAASRLGASAFSAAASSSGPTSGPTNGPTNGTTSGPASKPVNGSVGASLPGWP